MSSTAAPNAPSGPPTGSTGDDTSRLFRRLRALLAQADATTFAEERQAFEAKAQALMVEHGITLAMLAATTGRQEESVVRATVHVPGPHASVLGQLGWQVPALHDCRAVRGPRRPGTGGFDFEVFGWASEVAWVQLLVPRLVEHAHTELRRRRPPGLAPTASSQFARGFLQGYVREVLDRLTAVREQAHAQAVRDRAQASGQTVASTGRSVALALQDRTAEVDRRMRAAFPHLRSARPPAPSRSAEGRRAGRTAGAAAPIARHEVASRPGLPAGAP